MLTADIPAAPPACPPHQAARPQNRPKRTHPVRNAAIGSVSCLTAAAAAFLYGASLDDENTGGFIILAFFLTLIVVPCIIACATLTEVEARRSRREARHSRRQLPPRPGQGGQPPAVQRHGSTGHDPSPPGTRTDQTRTDLRAHRPQPDRPRPRGQGVPVPRGASPAPGAA
jgi:hypothetical protein